MKDEKHCKGTGKALGHGCGKLVKVEMYGKANRKFGLGLSCKCYNKWLMETDEGKALIERTTLKVTAPSRSLEEYKHQRKCETSLSYLKNRVMTLCHNYVKLRDKGKPCVSCGHPWRSDNQAGHWFKASDFSNLKYWEFNIHNQCIKCNIGKDGNVQEYGNRILLRVTQEQKDEMEQMARDYKKDGFKWSRIELNKIREYYKEKIKDFRN